MFFVCFFSFPTFRTTVIHTYRMRIYTWQRSCFHVAVVLDCQICKAVWCGQSRVVCLTVHCIIKVNVQALKKKERTMKKKVDGISPGLCVQATVVHWQTECRVSILWMDGRFSKSDRAGQQINRVKVQLKLQMEPDRTMPIFDISFCFPSRLLLHDSAHESPGPP